MYKIVFTGGGTAGHVVPNIAIMEETSKLFSETYYIGSATGIEKSLIEPLGVPFFSVPCAKLYRSSILQNLKLPFKLAQGVLAATKILKRIEPDVVFSKGGFVAVPTVLAAKALNIPIVCHESDLTLGAANKLTAKSAKHVLTSFPSTAKKLSNGLYVGPPIKRFNLINAKVAKEQLGFSGTKPLLLAFGGSQGAAAITRIIKKSARALEDSFNILLISGKNAANSSGNESFKEVSYISDMSVAYSAADVAVARCGSNSAFEILSLGIPVVFIPLQKGMSRGDQVLNAEYFLRRGKCLVLHEEELTEESVVNYVHSAYANANTPTSGNTRGGLILTDSSQKIAEILYRQAKLYRLKKTAKSKSKRSIQ